MSKRRSRPTRTALEGLADGELVTVTLVDGSSLTGTLIRAAGAFQLRGPDQSLPAQEIPVDRVAMILVRDRSAGPE